MLASVINDILDHHVSNIPNAECAVQSSQRLTFADVRIQVDEIAKALLAKGIQRGDRVATLSPPGLAFWLTYLAATSIGAIWHGINPVYRSREFQYLLSDADPSLVFCQSPFDERHYDAELQATDNGVECFVTFGEPQGDAISFETFLEEGSHISQQSLDSARDTVKPDDVAVIVYTSGTTGQPKGAMLSQYTITASALANAQWMGDRLDSTVCAAPTNHVGALNNVCMNVFAAGGRIIFYHRVDIEALGEIRRTELPTYMVTSPTGFMMTMQSPQFDASRLNHTKLIVCGGATTPLSILKAWAGVDCPISSVYGQTETCGIITHTDLEAPLTDVAETIGKPLQGCEVRVVKDDGTTCKAGETGELLFRGPYVMSGYYNRPEATAEAISEDGFLHTGDLGYIREDGNLVFVGRIKEMFKSGGYNVYPLEIEQAIAEHPSVLLCAVLPVPHPLFQEVGHAFVMHHDGHVITETEIREYLADKIANYKVPKTFSIETTLPLLPNGKVDKQKLTNQLTKSPRSGASTS